MVMVMKMVMVMVMVVKMMMVMIVFRPPAVLRSISDIEERRRKTKIDRRSMLIFFAKMDFLKICGQDGLLYKWIF